jgi:P27 family predicted phage terminase small subunit
MAMTTETEAPESEAETAAQAPRFMALTGDAAEIWDAFYPEMRKSGFVKQHELVVLARWCKHAARWVKLSAKVDAAGETYETESRHGKLQRINPDLNALLRIEQTMMAIEDRFGISPQARLRILTMKASTGGQGGLDLPTAPTASPTTPKADADGDTKVVEFPGIGRVPVRANA